MFGFVCLLLYAALSLQYVYVCMLCMYYENGMHLPCVWGKYTKGDRTIDRVRVNGLKWLVLIERTSFNQVVKSLCLA